MTNPKIDTQNLRKLAPYILAGLLMILGAYAMYRLLSPLDFHVLAQQIKATPRATIVKAMLATALGYMFLIGYDWSALRFIGKALPKRIVGLGSFLSYSIGNTIGLSAVSGGAIRYRIYSAHGISALDVAAISGFASIAFGVGSTILGLGALIIHPHALGDMVSWAPSTIRTIAIILLVAIVAVGGWVSKIGKEVKIWRFKFTPPDAPDLLRQIFFTFGDIAMASLVLYLLLPSNSLSYPNLLVVFTVATMAGVISHVPGGIGVFETVVLAALPKDLPLNDAVTGLLLFRIIYFLMPFAVAVLSLSIFEIWGRFGKPTGKLATVAPIFKATEFVIPHVVAALALFSGLFLCLASYFPNPVELVQEFEFLLPLAIFQGSVLNVSLAGSLLIILSISLWRRVWMSYLILMVALVSGAVYTLIYDVDIDRAVYLVILSIMMAPFYANFFRRSRISQLLLNKSHFLAIGLGVFGILLAFNHTVTDGLHQTHPWWNLLFDTAGFDIYAITLFFALILVHGFIFLALGPRHAKAGGVSHDHVQRAQAIIDTHGGAGEMLAITGDKMLMFAETGEAVLAYGVRGKSWIALGGPIGNAEGRKRLMWSFVEAARRDGARAVFYEADSEFVLESLEMGYSVFKMGEEAIVDLEEFSIEGSERKKLRTTYTRAGRDGLSQELSLQPHSDEVIAALKAISDEWLGEQSASEKQFSVGKFDANYLQKFPISIVRLNGEIVAFASLLMSKGHDEAAIDLMRFSKDAPTSTMEYLMTATMVSLKEHGSKSLSLGMAPLSGLEKRPGVSMWLKLGSTVFDRGSRFYRFSGLRQFKDKFKPNWKPRYLITKSSILPVAPLRDVTKLISG